MGKKIASVVCDIPVEFGGIGIGEATARLGLKISRSELELGDADEIFCGHRLTGRVLLGGKKESKGQKKLFDKGTPEVAGAFDCKRLSVSPEGISIGLTFSLADVNIADLAKFSKGEGRVIVSTVAEIPHDAADDAPEVDEKQKPLDLKFDTHWKKVPVEAVFSISDAKKLQSAELETIGKLCTFLKTKGWEYITGIGPKSLPRMQDRLAEFLAANPGAEEESGVPEPEEAEAK